jgi:hypothetical protein
MMRRLVAIVVAVSTAAISTLSAAEAIGSDASAFAKYVSGMSWPVQASTLRAHKVHEAVEGFSVAGDPPFLGQVAANCRSFRAVEATGHNRKIGAILRTTPVSALETVHRRLADTYTAARVGCVHTRSVALAARDAANAFALRPSAKTEMTRDRTAATARAELPRFDGVLCSFNKAARAWRAAVVRHARTVGITRPVWMDRLSLGCL